MKFAEDLVRLFADTLKEIPRKYIYGWAFLYYGLWFIVGVIFIVDWMMNGGQRSELLLLLDKL